MLCSIYGVSSVKGTFFLFRKVFWSLCYLFIFLVILTHPILLSFLIFFVYFACVFCSVLFCFIFVFFTTSEIKRQLYSEQLF